MFADRLKILRRGAKLTQKEFAQAINVAVGTVGMWEIGKREPDFNTTSRIADFFDVSVDYLLGREDPKETPTPVSESGLSEKDKRLARWFQSLPPETRKAILTLGGGPEDLAE